MRLYEANKEAIGSGDMTLFADTHAASCALKSLVTITTGEGIEAARRACGGHGFSASAGLGQVWADYLPQITWEGDSYMLTQQCTRYLFKVFRQLWTDPDAKVEAASSTVDYMRRYIKDTSAKADVKFSGDLQDHSFWIHAFGHRAAWQIGTSVRKRDIERRTWNSLLVEIFRCSKAHAELLTVANWAKTLQEDEELKKNRALLAIMTTCFEFYAAYTLDLNAAEFLASGFIDIKQSELIRNRVDELLAVIRPQAVSLVEGFALPDYAINSALGRSDGKVYEALVDFAARDPINATRFLPDIHSSETTLEPASAKL